MFFVTSAVQQGGNRDNRQHYYRTVETDSLAAKQWPTGKNISRQFEASKRPLLPCSNLSPLEIKSKLKLQQSKLPDQFQSFTKNFHSTKAH
ncbi:MAG: hypothetical protein ABJO97_05740 [Roseibium sp.]|uniref:hypothetical protein n=1 Tax=Alphaproteobacteria TaxID=28211 RepID=UPI0032664745